MTAPDPGRSTSSAVQSACAAGTCHLSPPKGMGGCGGSSSAESSPRGWPSRYPPRQPASLSRWTKTDSVTGDSAAYWIEALLRSGVLAWQRLRRVVAAKQSPRPSALLLLSGIFLSIAVAIGGAMCSRFGFECR